LYPNSYIKAEVISFQKKGYIVQPETLLLQPSPPSSPVMWEDDYMEAVRDQDRSRGREEERSKTRSKASSLARLI
jgi:hypothetical protein